MQQEASQAGVLNGEQWKHLEIKYTTLFYVKIGKNEWSKKTAMYKTEFDIKVELKMQKTKDMEES